MGHTEADQVRRQDAPMNVCAQAIEIEIEHRIDDQPVIALGAPRAVRSAQVTRL